MNDNQYLKALKKHLAGLDSKSRDDIVREIASSADDTVQDSLFNRFGAAEALAQQYLDGVTITPSLWQRLWRGSKLLIMGIGIVTLIAIVAIYWHLKEQDDFDYADPFAQELNEKTWHALAGAKKIDIYQSQVILYGNNSNILAASCARDGTEPLSILSDGIVSISNNRCFLKVPSQLMHISADQSEIVVNRLSGDKNIDIFQSKLRVVNPFNYKVDATIIMSTQDFSLDTLTGENTMTLISKQSSIEEYKMR